MQKLIVSLVGLILIGSAGHAGKVSDGPATSKARHQMVEATIKDRGISDTRVLAAMRAVLRHRFVTDRLLSVAYAD